jgi:hypothetical protein
MADISQHAGDPAVVFMVSAGLVYEIVAAACSSPQTAEINASTRSTTLMKWVTLGLGQAAFFVAIAIFLAEGNKRKMAAIAGGSLAGGIMWMSYNHANKSGLQSAAPGTEDWAGF